MSDSIADRLNLLIKALGHNPNSFSELIKERPQTLRNILSGRNKPGFDTLNSIITNSNVATEWLLRGEGEMFPPKPADIAPQTKPNLLSEPPVIFADLSGNTLIPMIDVKASAGWPAMAHNREWFEDLPVLSLPKFMVASGENVALQIQGNSMMPKFPPGTWIILTRLYDFKDIKQTRTGAPHAYVALTKDGPQFKRLRHSKRGVLILESDNTEIPVQQTNYEDILQIWYCKLFISFDFSNPNQGLLQQVDLMQNEINKQSEQILSFNNYISKSEAMFKNLELKIERLTNEKGI